MFDKFFTPLTPQEQARKDRQRAQQRADRNARYARQEELRKQRIENMPHFRVRQVREVLVQAADMNDAIALASAAFKEGQSADHSIKWGKPFGTEGDTKGPIRVMDVRAVEDWSVNGNGPHSRACGIQAHEHGIFCSIDCPTCLSNDRS